MKFKTAQQMLIQAAKLIDREDCEIGMCDALSESQTGGFDEHYAHSRASGYVDHFRPKGISEYGYWGKHFSWNPVERKRCRVLALCFAAAMADYDEKNK